MTEPDSGVGDPAYSFRVGGWRTEQVDSDQAEDVPEVMAARVQGYYPAPDDFLWCFIPAIWPQMVRVGFATIGSAS